MSKEEEVKVDIDSILDELAESKNEIVESNAEVPAIKEEESIDVTEVESIAKELVNMTLDDRKMADTLFQLFYPELANGKDKTTASKEAIAKSLELRIAAGRNMIDLLKVMKNDGNKNAIGMFFGDTMSGKKVGIDLGNISNELKNKN